MKNNTIKPFVKWAGGKTQLLNDIREKYPTQIKRYCEPFVGGGAVLLDILQNYQPSEVLINDINAELINTYYQVQNNVDVLIQRLLVLEDTFLNADMEQRRLIYNEKRNLYNKLKCANSRECDIEKGVLFIFLNKTCFNGLYRVNRKGEYNVPIGSYKKPLICDANNLTSISKLLKGVMIKQGDYKSCFDFIDNNTFVYIDPPYRPLTPSSSFTAYSENEFGDEQQIMLGKFIEEISSVGARVVASNSDPKNTNNSDDFFDRIYDGFSIKRVSARRMINSNGNGRGTIKELLICNY